MTEWEIKMLAQLTRVADAVEYQAALQMPEAPSDACQHPDDQRLDFGITAGQADWQCRLCGYRTVTEP